MLGIRSSFRQASIINRYGSLIRFNSSLPSKSSSNSSPNESSSTTTEPEDYTKTRSIDEIRSADFTPEHYPDVKRELYQHRDPYENWDDVQNRRNFNEPLHPEFEALSMWSPDYYSHVSDWTAVKWNLMYFSCFGILSGIIYYLFPPERISVPRNYPHNGLAKAFGARDEDEAVLYGARVDKSAS
ncbi:NADH dehydrogenase [ubiquinone] 1 beta subcomplex subunit 8, mitochondrial [Wickerhamomyces ciferrii]|uniref:NADH dehydrogenase [ubiquinone] 1 beta subcomplex subunit 8, mitochondrial n=1 Tax=Wickerhamomyces ciferrii (strain ATCC 14091 / BCRC 22168 / CBS 111 / JCM 3599 / NBRC 0793 / NRRL Y-1031 F-60-10) TaxID=1206466 RepID=K0KV63_WICCF|nr:NADH dehydrogenase [ubiquinone] 1 beta subcomplex subunit 8, mitochondrial [Wickerhamomyces ciferrii]CCH45777.1 NADH dehydrogenase [ubiquinone] 1 beta subcomplex subunit 8, mitochondrial [Wickerhamomyces ciferrii]